MSEQDGLVKIEADKLAGVVRAVGDVLVPLLNVVADAFKRAAERARADLQVLREFLGPRRPAPSKPCTWCSPRLKRPATHTVKWREPVVWWDEFDGTPTYWPAGRTMRMCQFHAKIAERYNGVRAYRFRRLK